MNQSLLDSFRGCLLGTININYIKSEKIILGDWEKLSQKIMIDLIQNETISLETCQEIFPKDSRITSGELILNILPLILFFHETENLLYEQLEKIKKNSDINPKMIEEVMLFREIIYLIVNGKNNNECLKTIFTLTSFLEEIQTLLNNQTPLTTLKGKFRQKTVLNNNYLCLSLYCFGRTPNNFKLSILQANRFNHPLILGVTAAISGAYNGYSSIPISWRLSMNQENNYESCYQQITQLWAKWGGVDDPFKIMKPIETQVINPVRVNNH